MTSDAFQRFEEDFLGDMTPAKGMAGLDIAALQQLTADERTQAETLLLQRLHEAPNDTRPVVGLGELHSAQAAPALKQCMPDATLLRMIEKWPGGMASGFVRVAVALWQIEEFEDSLRYLIDVLRRLPHHNGRMDAAIALRRFRRREAVQALLQTLNDPSDLVRYHAMHSLLVLYDLWQEGAKPHLWASAMMSADETRRSEAIAALTQAINADNFPTRS